MNLSRMKPVWTALTVLLIPLLVFEARSAARAQSSPLLQVSAVSHGIKLTLIVPRHTYPARALTRVSVQVQNISKRIVWLWGPGPMSPGISWPRVDVLDRSGRPLYPPLHMLVPATGPVPALVPLRGGARLSRVIYVMVQGPRLRASLSAAAPGDMAHPGPASTITTRPVRVQLKTERPPRVSVHTAPDSVFAEVQPLPGVHGPLYYIDSVACGGGSSTATLQWTRARGTRIAPTCSPPKEWHALVGWLNHPMAHVDYDLAPAMAGQRLGPLWTLSVGQTNSSLAVPMP